MRWNIGNVRITKIVEIAASGGLGLVMPQVTSEEVRKVPWLVPYLANKDGSLWRHQVAGSSSTQASETISRGASAMNGTT